MSTDRAKDKQAHQAETLADVASSNGGTSSIGIPFFVETEISDETLEAVAGGGVANPPLRQPTVDQG